MVLSQSQSRRAQSWWLPVSQPRGVALVTFSLILVCSPKIQQARCLRVRMCLMEPRGAPNDLEMFNAAFVRTNYWDVLIPAQGLIYVWISFRVQSYGPRLLPTSPLHAESLDMCPDRRGTTLNGGTKESTAHIKYCKGAGLRCSFGPQGALFFWKERLGMFSTSCPVTYCHWVYIPGVMDQIFVTPQIHMLKPYPQCDGIRRWAFGGH